MKNLCLLTALLGSALVAHAQQGSLYIGGQAGFNSTTTEADNGRTSTTTAKSSSWNLSPEVGTFLTNQLQLGVGFTFNGARQETPAAGLVTSTYRYGGTVYSRYFFGEGNFRPFLGLNLSVLPGDSRTERNTFPTGTTTYSTFDLGANLNAGFAYGLSKRVAVVGSFGTFGFQRSSSRQDGTDSKTVTTNFGLNANTLGNLFNVGLYYTFKQANAN